MQDLFCFLSSFSNFLLQTLDIWDFLFPGGRKYLILPPLGKAVEIVLRILPLEYSTSSILRILLKQDTALLSHVRVLVSPSQA